MYNAATHERRWTALTRWKGEKALKKYRGQREKKIFDQDNYRTDALYNTLAFVLIVLTFFWLYQVKQSSVLIFLLIKKRFLDFIWHFFWSLIWRLAWPFILLVTRPFMKLSIQFCGWFSTLHRLEIMLLTFSYQPKIIKWHSLTSFRAATLHHSLHGGRGHWSKPRPCLYYLTTDDYSITCGNDIGWVLGGFHTQGTYIFTFFQKLTKGENFLAREKHFIISHQIIVDTNPNSNISPHLIPSHSTSHPHPTNQQAILTRPTNKDSSTHVYTYLLTSANLISIKIHLNQSLKMTHERHIQICHHPHRDQKQEKNSFRIPHHFCQNWIAQYQHDAERHVDSFETGYVHWYVCMVLRVEVGWMVRFGCFCYWGWQVEKFQMLMNW